MIAKFLIVLGVLLIGALFIYILMHFLMVTDRIEDEEHQLRRRMKREYRDAQADLEHEIDIAERRSRREFDEESG